MPSILSRQLLSTARRAAARRSSSTSLSPWRGAGNNVGASRLVSRSFSALPETSTELALHSWGTDTKGSLLRPKDMQDARKMDIPTLVPLDLSIQKVECGATDTAILLENGDCYVWGENKHGQLGVGHAQPVQEEATKVHVSTPIRQVSLGNHMGAFVDEEGDLYTCGFGGSTFSGFGLLGHGDTAPAVHEPKLVESLVEDGCFVQDVKVSESHMTCLTTEGEVLTTGAGSYGRLGNFDTVDQLYFEPVEILTQGVTQIAGGKSFTLALTSEGVLYGWGRNHKGQLGTGLGLAVDMYAMQAIPEPIEADELLGRRVVKVAAGNSHAACITEGGELFFWGMALHLEPVRVNELMHTKVVDVVCGQDYTLALDEKGRLYSFGQGKTGVLGQGSIKTLNQPQVMEVFEDKRVVQVSAGWKHAACLVEA
jgi:alpha-tubulin suppressor-like RCC1 family protein